MWKPLSMLWMPFIERLSVSPLLRKIYESVSRVAIFRRTLQKFFRFAIPSDALVWTRIRSGPARGLWIHVNPRFEMEYLDSDYEAPVNRILMSHLKPGTVFFDVGAHIGLFSLIATRDLGAEGSVFAFEPDPSNLRRIREHVSRNHLDSLRIVPKAVWSTSGRMRFQRASLQSSMNRGAITDDYLASTIEVETITLDSIGREHALPSLIKIDVEGSEAAVLQGSEAIFQTAKPILICEIHHEEAASDVIRWLKARGYTFDWLENRSQFPRHLSAKYVG